MQIDNSGAHSAHAHHFGGARARTLAASIQGSRSQQTRLEVVTAEGDRVRLDAASRQDFSLDRYEASLRSAAGRAVTRGETLSINGSSSVSLQVEGDLNEEELADITKLVEDMQKMGSSLLSGTLDASFQLGGSLLAAAGQVSVSEQISATVERTRSRIRPGRAQRRAAREAGDIVRRRPERAARLQQILPKVADRVFDRLGEVFGQAPAEAARASFQSLLQREVTRAIASTQRYGDATDVAVTADSADSADRPKNPYEALAAKGAAPSSAKSVEPSRPIEATRPVEPAEPADGPEDGAGLEQPFPAPIRRFPSDPVTRPPGVKDVLHYGRPTVATA